MKNHTLMQTIARANRNAPGKQAGTIVDYVGVFANLQDALAIYGAPKGDAKPIRDKAALLEQLEEALAEAEGFCTVQSVNIAAILDADKLLRTARIGKAQEALIAPDEVRRGFLRRADAALRGYRAVLPDDRAAPFLRRVAGLAVVAQAVRNQLGPADISALAAQVHDKVAVFEWHHRQQTRSDVEWTIKEVLNTLPEEPYPEALWNAKVEATWQFVFGRPGWRPGQAAPN